MKCVQKFQQFCRPIVNNVNLCCQRQPAKVIMRHSVTFNKLYKPQYSSIRALGLGPTSKDFETKSAQSGPLTKLHASELVLHLTDDERKVLMNALQEYQSNKIKEEFEGTSIIDLLK